MVDFDREADELSDRIDEVLRQPDLPYTATFAQRADEAENRARQLRPLYEQFLAAWDRAAARERDWRLRAHDDIEALRRKAMSLRSQPPEGTFSTTGPYGTPFVPRSGRRPY